MNNLFQTRPNKQTKVPRSLWFNALKYVIAETAVNNVTT